MTEKNIKQVQIKIIASELNWLEGWSVEQLKQTANLEGMRVAVGMPDLHPGKGHPIGAAFISEGVFYPYLVGNDIGCGMALWQTDIRKRKTKIDRFVKKTKRFRLSMVRRYTCLVGGVSTPQRSL